MEIVSNNTTKEGAAHGGAAFNDKSLEEIVKESKENLSSEEPKRLKRGRGRPKKEAAREPEVVPAGPEVPSLEPILQHAVKLPYLIASRRTKFKGFELEDEDAKMLAQQANGILLRYLPNLGEGTSMIAVCVASFAMVTLDKVNRYEDWKLTLKKQAQNEAEAQTVVVQ